MCHRFVVLDRETTLRIAREIADNLAAHAGDLGSLDPMVSWHANLARPVPDAPEPREAFPGSTVAVVTPTGCGAQLAVADMTWGFDVSWKQGPVFNTRIETALGAGGGMWAESLARRRCVVPVRRFFESHSTETVRSPRTGRAVRRQYAFERTNGTPLLLAGIHDKGRFSLVTCEPCAAVAPVHNRMPLVLDAEGATLWLAGDFGKVLKRPRGELAVRAES